MTDPVLWYGLAALSVVALAAWMLSRGQEYEDERRKRFERDDDGGAP